ncbi:hypothetical protein HPP92_021725 [Vanilla planifolia]|uniref:Uncharacterized protein n=1 Tax=Vanilla planifolia TaxID=51239 RepID=A0A835PYP8_VANPL|nr:hypothetical protein HPP92_021725 [Vanilla planifolia]
MKRKPRESVQRDAKRLPPLRLLQRCLQVSPSAALEVRHPGEVPRCASCSSVGGPRLYACLTCAAFTVPPTLLPMLTPGTRSPSMLTAPSFFLLPATTRSMIVISTPPLSLRRPLLHRDLREQSRPRRRRVTGSEGGLPVV